MMIFYYYSNVVIHYLSFQVMNELFGNEEEPNGEEGVYYDVEFHTNKCEVTRFMLQMKRVA
jgi:hypothetical protein